MRTLQIGQETTEWLSSPVSTVESAVGTMEDTLETLAGAVVTAAAPGRAGAVTDLTVAGATARMARASCAACAACTAFRRLLKMLPHGSMKTLYLR